MNYNKDPKTNSTYNPPVNPYDLDFHRGKRNKKAGMISLSFILFIGDSGKTINAFQEEMAKTIKDYTQGAANINTFKAQLSNMNVPIDANLDKLIRKHESGDF